MRRVPVTPTMTLSEAFDAAIRAAGDARLAADCESVTLRELARRADALAGRLLGAGIQAGDHVGLLLPNGVRYVEAFFAVVRLGGVVVPLDSQLSARELEGIGQAVSLRATLAERPHSVPGCLDVTTAGTQWQVPGQPQPVTVPAARRRRDDPAAVFFTSGTTGHPKPVALTHHQLVRSLVALQRLHASFFSGSPLEWAKRLTTATRRYGSRLLGAAGRQTWLTTSPFRSIAGHQVLGGSLLLGHNLVTSTSFHPRRTLEMVDAHHVNVLAVTPAALELLLRVDDLSPYDLSSLLVIGVGGGPAAPDLVRRGEERFGCAVTIGYGSTELGGGVLATRLEDSPRVQGETVGRPFPGAAVRIVAEDGTEVPPGQPGELVCQSPGPVDDDGWVHTGDVAVRDEGGAVAVLGRKDDLVLRGGQNVHPLEVERVVEELPAVLRCGVVGVPSRGDQQLWAFVVPADGQQLSQQDVRRHCRAGLAPQKQPDRVRVVDALPATEQGEVRRHALREQAQAEVSHTHAREE